MPCFATHPQSAPLVSSRPCNNKPTTKRYDHPRGTVRIDGAQRTLAGPRLDHPGEEDSIAPVGGDGRFLHRRIVGDMRE